MYPCNVQSPQAPALYTYYAIMSLLVVFLAISLIWIPFVQLITEVVTIITKVMVYVSKELLGSDAYFLSMVEEAICSQSVFIVISILCLGYMLWLASGDFLSFAGSYVCNLPNHPYLERLKKLALGIIGFLLKLTRKTPKNSFSGNIHIHYHDSHGAHHSISQLSTTSE